MPNWFQHTATRRWLGMPSPPACEVALGFNTQPPEGGWQPPDAAAFAQIGFNTQPPEGGWFKPLII